MNKTFVLSSYGRNASNALYTGGEDLTHLDNTLKSGSGVFQTDAAKVFTNETDKVISFQFRNQLGVFEPLVRIQRPVTYTKGATVDAVKKAAKYLLGNNIETLASGKQIHIQIHNLDNDPYDKLRITNFTYTLTQLDNVTTHTNAAYYVTRMAAAFNAQHGTVYTMAKTTTDEFSITTTTDTFDFKVSVGGVYLTLTETVTQAYVRPINQAAQVAIDEKDYSTERGSVGYTADINNPMYKVPSNVDSTKKYVTYILKWEHLSTEHPLGQGTTSVTRLLTLYIDSTLTNDIAALDAILPIVGINQTLNSALITLEDIPEEVGGN